MVFILSGLFRQEKAASIYGADAAFFLLLLQKRLTVKGWCGPFADVLEELVPAGGEGEEGIDY